MRRREPGKGPTDPFDAVREVGLTWPDVEVATKYDGSPVLKVNGIFVAGLATHRSAESGTLVVRIGIEERQWLLEDAPETYYVTDYYLPYPRRTGAALAGPSGCAARSSGHLQAAGSGEGALIGNCSSQAV